MKPSFSKTILPVFLFFLLLLLSCFSYGIAGFYKAVKSNSWPTATGIILSSQVIKPSGKSTKYIADIKYSYKSNNKEYHSNKFNASNARGISGWARNVVKQYPINSSAKIYYNPDNPEDSVIEPGLQYENYYMTGIPLVSFMLLLLTLLKQFKNRNKNARQFCFLKDRT
jgi:hypothetical protein